MTAEGRGSILQGSGSKPLHKNMNQLHELVRRSVLISILMFTASPAGAAIKCWTNNEGVRECGNTVPPEYAQKGSKTINKHGLTVDVKERARTREEMETERHRRELEQRKAEEEKRRIEEQARYDRVLLATFVSVDEIVASRDRKLAAIDGTIEVTRLTVETLERKLEQYRKRAGELEKRGSAPPDDLRENMASVQYQIEDNRAFIAKKEEEKAVLREKYERDVARFLELTSGR